MIHSGLFAFLERKKSGTVCGALYRDCPRRFAVYILCALGVAEEIQHRRWRYLSDKPLEILRLHEPGRAPEHARHGVGLTFANIRALNANEAGVEQAPSLFGSDELIEIADASGE